MDEAINIVFDGPPAPTLVILSKLKTTEVNQSMLAIGYSEAITGR